MTLKVSLNHYLKVDGSLKAASQVSFGSQLVMSSGNTTVVPRLETVTELGLYNPHTLEGQIVVDGVVAPCFTRAIHPSIANALLIPLKGLFSAGTPIFRFLDYSSPTAHLPIGPPSTPSN